jgi:2-polyprenyl-6-methoxyphenol hydroxylase-like FAD-dependent oxidoreductase
VRIAVLGDGPCGLLAALLAKRGDPGREVTVFERNRASDTFGFGVVFSDATLDGVDAADPVLRRALTTRGVHWDPIEVRLRGERSARTTCWTPGTTWWSRRTARTRNCERGSPTRLARAW